MNERKKTKKRKAEERKKTKSASRVEAPLLILVSSRKRTKPYIRTRKGIEIRWIIYTPPQTDDHHFHVNTEGKTKVCVDCP